ncbi:hypothetical protein [Mixta hanseatica]|uniref:Membrane protein 6-pyruvoyl-tetrahydropterin synthase-related domain-containing protein n=1 Tax=Mixta hanseatica TaxID=2872648 RepID=A0ABY4RCA1_9GAMM|nr:hypothetical protein [Mixta hanseatica]UQY45312.1 hypothetical protein K6958_06450 [Mixta hanseatica]
MKRNRHIVLFALASLFVLLYPCFMGGTFYSYDAMAHFQRMKDINNQLYHINMPPLFDYYSDNWYGYSWNMFYPPLSAYLMGLIKAFSLYSISDVTQFKISIAVIIIIAFASMYLSSFTVLRCRYYAAIAAILFVGSGYFLNDAYIRIDAGELMAMAFAPMIITGARAIIKDVEGKALFPLGVLAVLLSNIPSFIVCLIYITLYFTINVRMATNKQNLIYIAKCIIFVSAASLFFTIPLIYHFFKGDVFAFHALAVSYNTIGKFGVSITELIFSEPLTTGMTTKGLVISSGLVLNILLFCYLFKSFIPDSLGTKSIAIIALLFFAASTNLFPWYMISEKTPLIRFIQFPWRLMLIAVPATVIVSVFFLKSINSTILNATILTFSFIFSFFPMQSAMQNRVDEIRHHEFHDYMNTDFEDAKERNISKIQEIKNKPYLLAIIHSWSSITFKVSASESGEIELPVMYYAGYQAKYNGSKIPVSSSEDGITIINGPIQGDVELSYNKLITLIPFIFSSLFILLSLLLYLRKSRKKPR